MDRRFGQLRLQHLDRGQRVREICGEGAGQLPARYADRLGRVPQCVLHDQLILAIAQKQADGWSVVGMAQQSVYRREVEVRLTGVLGLEIAGFELDREIGAQPEVLEQHVQIEVLAPNLEMDSVADEGKAYFVFRPNASSQGTWRLWVQNDSSAGWVTVSVLAGSISGCCVHEGLGDVKHSLFGCLGLVQEADVVTPRNLCNHSLHKFRIGPSLGESLHVLGIAQEKSRTSGKDRLRSTEGWSMALAPQPGLAW